MPKNVIDRLRTIRLTAVVADSASASDASSTTTHSMRRRYAPTTIAAAVVTTLSDVSDGGRLYVTLTHDRRRSEAVVVS